MSINSTITGALDPLGVPVAFHEYVTGDGESKPPFYIEFFTYLQMGDKFADDTEKSTSYSIQVDVYGQSPVDNLAKQVKTALLAVGFTRTAEYELYNKADTNPYRKMISLRGTIDN
jgi:hypothetical protein